MIQFLLHARQEYISLRVNNALLSQAQRLVDKHTLRTLDGIQLASAIAASKTLQLTPIFLSADPKLLAAAASEGFAIDNPLNHP